MNSLKSLLTTLCLIAGLTVSGLALAETARQKDPIATPVCNCFSEGMWGHTVTVPGVTSWCFTGVPCRMPIEL